MKYFIFFLILMVSIKCFSQQNFINVPSSEVTAGKRVFFQQQLNFNELIQSNTTLDFGLGNGFEIGANVLGMNFSENGKTFFHNDSNDVDPYNPLVALNGLKQIELNKNLAITVGSQVGLNFDSNKKKTEASLFYSNLSMKNMWLNNSNLLVGSYYNSKHYGGKGTRLGVWLGSEVPLNQKLHLMAESIIGNNAFCYTSLGIIYYPVKWMPLTFGISIPNTKKNSYSFVFELTAIPHSKKQK